MRSYERNGVVVDQCTGCRGVFLDRGELERLTEAESAHYGGDRDSSRDRERDRHGSGKRKKRSFLEGLFEGE
jgi:uncharacterized protein